MACETVIAVAPFKTVTDDWSSAVLSWVLTHINNSCLVRWLRSQWVDKIAKYGVSENIDYARHNDGNLKETKTKNWVAQQHTELRQVKLLSAASSKKGFFAIFKWRMVSNVRISPITVSTKNRIFRAKRQLSLIPLNRTAALPQRWAP